MSSPILKLTWNPRVRGSGAGIGDPDTIVDGTPTWEGLFEVEVFIGGVKITDNAKLRDVNARTLHFTAAEILAYSVQVGCPGAPCYPSEILFKVYNYVTTGGVTYNSGKASVKVTNWSGCDCGNATTTTTSTTTTSSSTTTTSTTATTSSTSSTASTTSTTSSTSSTASTTSSSSTTVTTSSSTTTTV